MPRVNGNSPGSPSSTAASQPARLCGVYVLIACPRQIVAERAVNCLDTSWLRGTLTQPKEISDGPDEPDAPRLYSSLLYSLYSQGGDASRRAGRRPEEDIGMDDVVNRFARELADAIAAAVAEN